MTSWTSPFQEWMNQEMVGIAASPEIMLLLAKAFDGGKRYERETCAKSVYDSTDWAHEERDMVLKEAIAAAIRARGEK